MYYRRSSPFVITVCDHAFVRKRDVRKESIVIGNSACAAFGVDILAELPIGIEALADGEAEAACAAHLAVGDLALGGAAPVVFGVAGAADEAVTAVLLFIAAELAVGVVLVPDALVGLCALQLVFFRQHLARGVVGVVEGVGSGINALGELAFGVVAVLDGAAHGAGFLCHSTGFVVLKAVGIAIGIGHRDELIQSVPALLGGLAYGVDALDAATQRVVVAEGGFIGRVGAGE